MNEEEAKTKWCPFTRAWSSGNRFGPHAHTDGDDSSQVYRNETRCIASACMAWREDRQPVGDLEHPRVVGGYCGLAGKP